MCINSLTQIKEKQTLTIPSIDNDVKTPDSTYRNINRRKAASSQSTNHHMTNKCTSPSVTNHTAFFKGF